MPDVYGAQEVILNINWDIKVDIWSIAMAIWHLVARRTFFKTRNDQRLLDDTHHPAEMVAIMGPPKQFLERSEMSCLWWEQHGVFSLERFAEDIEEENKKGCSEISEGFYVRCLRKPD
ncbi:kinase domain-containing protein [Paracoccidioides lutzii Pb01]|uniref:Kinase domain-containing protein n=1 Tax=Paracoccidioides lutzii (strain ATCC MYA-826 / Pb01) TaxID=502779 RepID=C1H9H5_PARBA|nr:kinase domain-containing protein [Paracoccidioides lutzii Pb01]EEH36998.2 kinase domain-containing protein [Paracoccidioides lutzii Pb01]